MNQREAMRPWDHLLIGDRNPFAYLTSGLRKVTLDEAAYEAAKEADTIRRGQKMLDEPSLVTLRVSDCLEFSGRTLRLLALDENRARAFIKELQALNG